MSTTESLPPAKAKSLVEFASAKQGALTLKDKIHTDGHSLTHSGSRQNVDFMVQYHGFWFAVNADQQGTTAVLHIHAMLGHLPYSYESAFLRENLLFVVSSATKDLGGRFYVDHKQNILLIETIRIHGSLTPKMILTETTKVMLKIRPYLDLITTLQPVKETIYKAPEIKSVGRDPIAPDAQPKPASVHKVKVKKIEKIKLD